MTGQGIEPHWLAYAGAGEGRKQQQAWLVELALAATAVAALYSASDFYWANCLGS